MKEVLKGTASWEEKNGKLIINGVDYNPPVNWEDRKNKYYIVEEVLNKE